MKLHFIPVALVMLMLSSNACAQDTMARYKGDDFIVLFLDTKSKTDYQWTLADENGIKGDICKELNMCDSKDAKSYAYELKILDYFYHHGYELIATVNGPKFYFKHK